MFASVFQGLTRRWRRAAGNQYSSGIAVGAGATRSAFKAGVEDGTAGVMLRRSGKLNDLLFFMRTA